MALRIVTANRVADGEVVYLGEGGKWAVRVDLAAVAAVASDDAAAESLMAVAREAEAAARVVEPYLIEVVREGAAIVPVRIRERMRAGGPSVRPDLGKQAEARGAG